MRGRRRDLNSFLGQVDNFLKRVNMTNGCWNWVGSTTQGDYGFHKFYGKAWRAHRLSYHLFLGNFDKSLDVCHTCDNPRCVRPSHLFLGTTRDNIQDMINKGRYKGVTGSMNPRAKLTEEKVKEIRRLRQSGMGLSELSERFNANYYTINNIVNRWSWKHVN